VVAARPADIAQGVDGNRLWQRLMALARHGARADGGVDRPALSETEIAARHQLISWGRALGLAAFTDELANLFLRYEGREPDLAPVMAGSHIDSQPTGGKFDGTFGVLAALEAVEAMAAHGVRPRRSIEVVAWTNEEASRFAPGMMGSEAFTGSRDPAKILAVKDHAGISVAEAVAGVLAADPEVPKRALLQPVAAFIEPHIEQGPVLERAGVPIGVVSGIQGTRRYRVRVTGEAAHAGTTPRPERRDALLAALRMILAVDSLCEAAADTLSTVGMLKLEPNAPSVVPGEAYFSIDVRQRDNAVLEQLGTAIPAAIERERGPCSVDIAEIAHAPSVEFDERIQSALRSAAVAMGIPYQDIYSAAGHDARHLAYVCPTGMLFVPCRDGISHNPAEFAEPKHLTAGARVLTQALWELADA
jgi:beta-ureidopropionase / N-carbamoyl-L-amino-acid hydrolase